MGPCPLVARLLTRALRRKEWSSKAPATFCTFPFRTPLFSPWIRPRVTPLRLHRFRGLSCPKALRLPIRWGRTFTPQTGQRLPAACTPISWTSKPATSPKSLDPHSAPEFPCAVRDSLSQAIPCRPFAAPPPPFFRPPPRTSQPPPASAARRKSFPSSILGINCSPSIPFRFPEPIPPVFPKRTLAPQHFLPTPTVPLPLPSIRQPSAHSPQTSRLPTTLPDPRKLWSSTAQASPRPPRSQSRPLLSRFHPSTRDPPARRNP